MASTQASKTVPQNCPFQQSTSGTSDMVSNVGWEPVFSCDMSCHIILKQQKIICLHCSTALRFKVVVYCLGTPGQWEFEPPPVQKV